MIHDENAVIRTALSDLTGVRCITRGWPKTFASNALPCIAIQRAGVTPYEAWDDHECVTEMEYYIRVFAEKSDETDAIGAAVFDRMKQIGYERTMDYDADESSVRIRHMRFRRYVYQEETN